MDVDTEVVYGRIELEDGTAEVAIFEDGGDEVRLVATDEGLSAYVDGELEHEPGDDDFPAEYHSVWVNVAGELGMDDFCERNGISGGRP